MFRRTLVFLVSCLSLGLGGSFAGALDADAGDPDIRRFGYASKDEMCSRDNLAPSHAAFLRDYVAQPTHAPNQEALYRFILQTRAPRGMDLTPDQLLGYLESEADAIRRVCQR